MKTMHETEKQIWIAAYAAAMAHEPNAPVHAAYTAYLAVDHFRTMKLEEVPNGAQDALENVRGR